MGNVRIFGYFERQSPSCLASATVTFAPGARTLWKVNPLGQTLIVTSGVGWAQAEGEPIVEIRPGDIVWCPPGRRHWDGATPDQAMTYVAVQKVKHGRYVQFGDKVSDEEYGRGSTRLTQTPCAAIRESARPPERTSESETC